MEIKTIAKEINQINKDHGFWDDPNPNIGEKLMLVVTELAEALEADRKGIYADLEGLDKALNTPLEFFQENIPPYTKDQEEHFNNFFCVYVKDTYEDELADACIRLFDLAGQYNIDLEKHIELKVRYNKGRPYKHGKKY